MKASMARRPCLSSASRQNFMLAQPEMPKGSKPWSPGMVPSSESGRLKIGMMFTPCRGGAN
jgi:hypothetical protein